VHEIELLVSLKIPDVTALTAANTLRRRMGLAERLDRLQRADYYRLKVDAESEEKCQDLVTELAERTNHFVNPNKHRFAVRTAQPRLNPPSQDGSWEIEVLITDAEGDRNEDLEQALGNDPTAAGKVKAVHTGVLWIMVLKAESGQDALELAREITITRARDQGLLANPHFQSVQIS